MFRVSILPALEHDHGTIYTLPVKCKEVALEQLNAVAMTLIHLGDSGAMPSYSNCLTIEELTDSGWTEVDDED